MRPGMRSFIFFPLRLPLVRKVTHFRHWTPNTRSRCSARCTHARNACRSSLRDSSSLPSFVLRSPPCSSLFSAPMYANPVYELAKCTRKCIRRTINCRSGRESVAELWAEVGRNWVNLGSEFYQYYTTAYNKIMHFPKRSVRKFNEEIRPTKNSPLQRASNS